MRPHLASTSFDRHYGAPIAARWFLRCFVAAVEAIVVALLFGNEGGSFGTAVGIIAVAALVAVLAWGERSFPRWGLYESERELRSVHSLGSQRFPWDMIDRFDQSKTWPKSRVLVVVKNGKVVSIVGTAQGSRIAWDGGETRDIVGVLNERLRAWEAQHGAI